MIPNSKAFNGKSFYEFDGKTIYRWHRIQRLGDYQINVRVVQINSNHKQGIALFFSDFKGMIKLNGSILPVLKGKFKHYTFKQDDILHNEISLTIHAEAGALVIGNASQVPGDDCYECGALGCAFWIEELSPDCARFHCNDHEYDDDFNDLIFDLEIVQNHII